MSTPLPLAFTPLAGPFAEALRTGTPNCAGTDSRIFFAEYKGDASHVDAKRVCARCPLIDLCREWAVEHVEAGVWGGTTEHERQRIRARRRVPEQGRSA